MKDEPVCKRALGKNEEKEWSSLSTPRGRGKRMLPGKVF